MKKITDLYIKFPSKP